MKQLFDIYGRFGSRRPVIALCSVVAFSILVILSLLPILLVLIWMLSTMVILSYSRHTGAHA